MVQCSQMCSRSWSGQLSRSSLTSQLCPFAPTLCAYRIRAISRYAASRRRCSACVSGASSRAPVQRTCHATPAAVEDMCVDHGGAHVAVAEQLLIRPDVVAILEHLPAPFGPTIPRIRPSSTRRSTPSKAMAVPNVFRRPRASMHGMALALLLGGIQRRRVGRAGFKSSSALKPSRRMVARIVGHCSERNF